MDHRILGILQYFAPGLQFLCGVVVYGEAMPASRWIGFALVWAGLAVFTVASMINYHRSPRRTVAAAGAGHPPVHCRPVVS